MSVGSQVHTGVCVCVLCVQTARGSVADTDPVSTALLLLAEYPQASLFL